MRTIKFRGKRIDNGEWVYGYLYEDIKPNRHLSYILELEFIPASTIPSNKFIEVDQKTVGQFTGLLDKNGVEIYEGDVINAYDHPTNMESIKSKEVVYVGCAFRDSYNGYVLQDSYTNIEVIGNIHENPELLLSK